MAERGKGKVKRKRKEGCKEREGVAAETEKEESNLGLRMIIFISFFKVIRFGSVQLV